MTGFPRATRDGRKSVQLSPQGVSNEIPTSRKEREKWGTRVGTLSSVRCGQPPYQSAAAGQGKVRQGRRTDRDQRQSEIRRGGHFDAEPGSEREISRQACRTFRQQDENAAGNHPYCKPARGVEKTSRSGHYGFGSCTTGVRVHGLCSSWQHCEPAPFGATYWALGSTT
jgi:hypothetical protein